MDTGSSVRGAAARHAAITQHLILPLLGAEASPHQQALLTDIDIWIDEVIGMGHDQWGASA
eukprot:365705-Chlamydomonas_euryale.AAC.5